MSSVLDGVNQRTQLVGRNRFELLLFRLGGQQLYGINVFKVQEVIQCPPLTVVPGSNSKVRGIANLRGRTVAVADLAHAVGKRPLPDPSKSYLIITEYNRSMQGFLVSGVERIVNLNWEEILPPPSGAGKNTYMTAVTRVDEKIVEIIDVEKVLSEIMRMNTDVSEELADSTVHTPATETSAPRHVLVVDDSSVARNQVKRTLQQIGIEATLARDGQEGLETLQEWVNNGDNLDEKLLMVISDVEMPKMDGYTLTKEIRNDGRLSQIYVMLHTSLSGVFNTAMVKKVGADEFLPKYNPDELAMSVKRRIDSVEGRA